MTIEHLRSIVAQIKQMPGTYQRLSLGCGSPEAVGMLRQLGATVRATYYAPRSPSQAGYVIVSASLIVDDVEVCAQYDRPASPREVRQAEAGHRTDFDGMGAPWGAPLALIPGTAEHAAPEVVPT